MLSSDALFERSNQALLKAINDVTEYANQAGLQAEKIPLTVMRAVLEQAFASPEQTGSQFMTGQITVCSMVPMRSIPFRIVAILGLIIINPPQSAILGMHNIIQRPVAVDGEVVIRPMMYVALSYDHRVIDGRESVGTLVAIKEALENPAEVLMEGNVRKALGL